MNEPMTVKEIKEWLGCHLDAHFVTLQLDSDGFVNGMTPASVYRARQVLSMVCYVPDNAHVQPLITDSGRVMRWVVPPQPQAPPPSREDAGRRVGEPPIQLRITPVGVGARHEGRYQVCLAGQLLDDIPWYNLPAVLDACLAFLMHPGTIGIECGDWFPAHLLWKAIDAHEWWCVETPGLGWPTNIRAVIYINGERVVSDPHPVLQED